MTSLESLFQPVAEIGTLATRRWSSDAVLDSARPRSPAVSLTADPMDDEPKYTNERRAGDRLETSFKLHLRVLIAALSFALLVGCQGGSGSSGEEDEVEPGEVVVEITLAEFVEPDVVSSLVVRAGVARSDGSVDYSPVIDIDLLITNGTSSRSLGVIDRDGFFESDVTLTQGFDLLIVFATATTPNGDTATATAQARAIVPNLPITLEARISAVGASAHAAAGGDGQNHRPAGIVTDSNFFGSFREAKAASISDAGFPGSANGAANATQDSIIFSEGDGESFSGGRVSGTCNASGSTFVTPPFSPDLLIGTGSASSGIDMTFRIDGDGSYQFSLDGSFSGTVGGSGTPSGLYRLADLVGCDAACEGINYNPNQDGATLFLSERVTLPAGGRRYRLELAFDCTAAAFNNTATAEIESTMEFTFGLTPLEN